MTAATLHVLRVFTDASGRYGNPLGVFLDGPRFPLDARQRIAHDLGFSETVFVDNATTGQMQLYTPLAELPFAGHPLVGTAWLMHHLGQPAQSLNPPAGRVPVRHDGEIVWIAATPEWGPTWSHIHASSLAEVESANEAPDGHDHVQLWAFQDHDEQTVRARTFAPRFGVREDEACGSASMILTRQLNRPLTIHHGQGSEILTRPLSNGIIELGGRVVLDTSRKY